MTTRCRRLAAATTLVLTMLGAGLSARQAAAPAPSGHWTGSLDVGPGLGVEVDLGRQGESWRGTISIPAQGTKGLPLSDIAVKDTTVEWALKAAPGDPHFSGTLSADGKSISGTFSQGGGSIPLVLTWKGEPQFDAPVKNAAIDPALVGTWEGSLDVKGTVLRLALTLANGPDGATGKLVSLDQNNFEMPVAKIVGKGTHLELAIPMVSGAFDGELKGGEIAGTWTQGPLSLPLVFKKRP